MTVHVNSFQCVTYSPDSFLMRCLVHSFFPQSWRGLNATCCWNCIVRALRGLRSLCEWRLQVLLLCITYGFR